MSGLIVWLILTAGMALMWYITAKAIDALIDALTWTCGDCGKRYSLRTRACKRPQVDRDLVGGRP